MLILRCPPIRLSPADEAVCRRWTSVVLGVVATISVIVLATPMLRDGSPYRSALQCVDDGSHSTGPTPHPSVACPQYQSWSNVRPGSHSYDAALDVADATTESVHQVASGGVAVADTRKRP